MQHLIKIALILLAAVAAYFVYGFTALVAHPLFAVLAAGSLVGTYIGLAFAHMPKHQQHRAQTVAQGAMVIEAIYGTLYVLHVQSPQLFAGTLPLWLSVPLAVLHGAAFSVLAYFVSLFIVHEHEIAPSAPVVQIDMTPLVAELRALAAPALIAPQIETFPAPRQINTDQSASNSVNTSPLADRTCRHCGTDGLTQSDLMAHGRARKKRGACA